MEVLATNLDYSIYYSNRHSWMNEYKYLCFYNYMDTYVASHRVQARFFASSLTV